MTEAVTADVAPGSVSDVSSKLYDRRKAQWFLRRFHVPPPRPPNEVV